MNNNPFHNDQELNEVIDRLDSVPSFDASDLIFNIEAYRDHDTHAADVPRLLKSMLNEVFALDKVWQQLSSVDSGDNKSNEDFSRALQILKKFISVEISAHEDCLNEGMANSSTKVMGFFGPLVSKIEGIDDEDRTFLLMYLSSFKDYRVDFIEEGLHELSLYMEYLANDSKQNEELKIAIDEALESYDDDSTIESLSNTISSSIK